MYGTENCIQDPMINHNEKEYLKKSVYICITKSLLYIGNKDNTVNQLYLPYASHHK